MLVLDLSQFKHVAFVLFFNQYWSPLTGIGQGATWSALTPATLHASI
jgi:hypothetical protein